MIDDIRRLLDEYSAWLRDRTSLREVGTEYVEITTPYLDRNNDCLQIYVRQDETGGYVLTDAGETIAELRMSGCELDTPKRRELLHTTLNGFAVQIVDGALQVATSSEGFPLRKHSLVQAMLAVNDLFYLASPSIASLFHEDVARWLAEAEVRSTPRVVFVGKTGFQQHFDFAIPASRTHPERIINALAYPDRGRTSAVIHAWEDTKETRPQGSRFYVMLNDSEQEVRKEVTDAFRNYQIVPIKWSERARSLAELAN